MSQTEPLGGFQVDAGVSIPVGDGPYGRDPVTKGDVAVVLPAHDGDENTAGYVAASAASGATDVHSAPVDTGTVASMPNTVGPQGDNSIVQTDNDPANVSGPAPEVGLSDVYGAVQALDAKIDGLISSQSPWVGAQPDTDD